MNPQISDLDIGVIGEHLAIADIMLQGYSVFATRQGMSYDLVIQGRERLLKVQVKTTRFIRQMPHRVHPIYFFNIKRTGKNGAKKYKDGDFDIYALAALDRRMVFYLAYREAKSSSICVRDREVEYLGGQGARCSNASGSGLYLQDLTLESALKSL